MPTNEEEKGEKEDAVDGGTADTGVDQLRQRLQQQQQQCLVKERTMSVGPPHGQQKEDASMAQAMLLCLSLLYEFALLTQKQTIRYWIGSTDLTLC